MGMTLQDVIRLVTPPVLLQLVKRLRGSRRTAYGLTGDYRSWEEAVAASSGYDGWNILEKTRAAVLLVKNGQIAYERDSVLFDEVQYTWPVLAGLMWVAASYAGQLNVLDYGGSLGSSYFQNELFLSALPGVRWNVVEQPLHVEAGKESFEDAQLRFYANISDCLADTTPNVALLSGVLQYLEHPYDVLNQIMELPNDYVIIDRLPFWDGSMDRLCVQTVPPDIYTASYPIWIFSKQRFRSLLDDDWDIIVRFESLDDLPSPVPTTWQGMILQRRRGGFSR